MKCDNVIELRNLRREKVIWEEKQKQLTTDCEILVESLISAANRLPDTHSKNSYLQIAYGVKTNLEKDL